MNSRAPLIVALLVVTIVILAVIAYNNSRSPLEKAVDAVGDTVRDIKN